MRGSKSVQIVLKCSFSTLKRTYDDNLIIKFDVVTKNFKLFFGYILKVIFVEIYQSFFYIFVKRFYETKCK